LTVSLDGQVQAGEPSRELLDMILKHLPDAVLVVASDGRILFSNPAYDALFGLEGDRLDQGGQPLPADQTPGARASRGEAFTMAFRATGTDGSVRWFEAKGRPVPLGGDEAVIIQYRDISERTLRLLQEEFIARAGHELRTPLTALHAYVQLLSRRPEVRSLPMVASYVDNALAESKRLAGLITELTDAVRLEAGMLQFARQPVDVADVARRVVDISQALTETQGIRYKGRRPVIVEGDPSRIEQVILNLLSNAITHAPRSRYIDVHVGVDGDDAVLQVADQGPGVSRSDLPHLFARFYQVSRKRGGSERGMGLGLYISREIVRAHRGRIDVESEPGKGTTFTVRLPLAADVSIASPPQ
jgi:two-component system phosphate regulon sensor histidine kinase PhoR